MVLVHALLLTTVSGISSSDHLMNFLQKESTEEHSKVGPFGPFAPDAKNVPPDKQPGNQGKQSAEAEHNFLQKGLAEEGLEVSSGFEVAPQPGHQGKQFE